MALLYDGAINIYHGLVFNTNNVVSQSIHAICTLNISNVINYKFMAGRAVTNVVRTCGPTHLLVFDFMSNKICLNHYKFSHATAFYILNGENVNFIKMSGTKSSYFQIHCMQKLGHFIFSQNKRGVALQNLLTFFSTKYIHNTGIFVYKLKL